MAAIVLRTGMVYIFLIIALRIMGKRQLGELQVGELVTALLLSEMAALPVYDQNIPIIFAAAPVLLILSLGIIASFVSSRSPLAKKIIEGTPSVLICRGVVNQHELKRNRICLDELLGELRLKSISDITEVWYAILEQNGRLSVIPRAAERPATAGDVGQGGEESGMAHPIIMEGKISKSNLSEVGKNRRWLKGELDKKKIAIKDVYLLSIDDAGAQNIIVKEKSK